MPVTSEHDQYIRMAIAQAERGDTPFGAVIVQHGKIIATGYNTVRSDNDATAHSEINALRAAYAELGSTNLEDCILYSNAEPCPMCMAAILWSQVPVVVYGASVEAQAEYMPTLGTSCRVIAAASGRRVQIIGGVLEDLCLVPFRLLHDSHQK